VITGDEIRGTYDAIRPYIRRTPSLRPESTWPSSSVAPTWLRPSLSRSLA